MKAIPKYTAVEVNKNDYDRTNSLIKEYRYSGNILEEHKNQRMISA